MSDPLKLLSDEGVAVWLDDMSRARLVSGNLKALVRDKHVVGVTTNPTIFHKAITGSDVYDEQIAQPGRAGHPGRRGDPAADHRTTCARSATCCGRSTTPPTVSTGGCRSRSTPAWPTTPRAPRPRPSCCGGWWTAPT